MTKKIRLALVLVAALALTAGVALTRTGDGPTPPPPAAPILELAAADLHRLTESPVEDQIPLSGTLHPLDQTVVKARVSGEVQSMAVREGESVRKDQVLARFDDTEWRTRVAERTALLEAARAELEQARRDWDMQQQLLRQAFISKNAANSAQRALLVGEANLRAAEAQLDLARKDQADTVVTAPLAGTVAQRHALPGEKVAANAPLLTLVDLSRVELEAEVPAARISQVRVGAQVRFGVEGLGERRFQGRVARINPTADPRSRMIKVYVEAANPDRLLRGGLFAQGVLATGQRAPARLAPVPSLREDATGSYVLALAGGPDTYRVERVAVKVGRRFAETGQVELLAGPAPGTLLINGPLANLKAGDQARMVNAAPALKKD